MKLLVPKSKSHHKSSHKHNIRKRKGFNSQINHKKGHLNSNDHTLTTFGKRSYASSISNSKYSPEPGTTLYKENALHKENVRSKESINQIIYLG